MDVVQLLGSGRRPLRESPSPSRPSHRDFSNHRFFESGSEQIDYGYLTLAHTSGDIYVFFKTSNVLAVGDVASPLRDPALDWFTGAWIGGRVDSMDTLLTLAMNRPGSCPRMAPS